MTRPDARIVPLHRGAYDPGFPRYVRPISHGDRPATAPGGMECSRCGCIFIGEEWHEFCAVCIANVAREIADSQGEVVINEPSYSIAEEARTGDAS